MAINLAIQSQPFLQNNHVWYLILYTFSLSTVHILHHRRHTYPFAHDDYSRNTFPINIYSRKKLSTKAHLFSSESLLSNPDTRRRLDFSQVVMVVVEVIMRSANSLLSHHLLRSSSAVQRNNNPHSADTHSLDSRLLPGGPERKPH